MCIRDSLYIDEVNLLEDHIVDLLLDVAVSGENLIEREGLSVKHDSKFVLIGSGNPEEGELRPQLLDRFGLSVEVKSPNQLEERMNRFKEILPPHPKKETHPQLIALGIMLLSILIIDIMGYYHGNMTLLETLKNL